MDKNFTTDVTSSSSDVVIAKTIAAVTLFLVSVISGIIPFKLAQVYKWNDQSVEDNKKREQKTKLIVSILLCFGGGVLLATTFLHLLPDIKAEILVLQQQKLIPNWQVALAELLMCGGFFLIYLIEELVHNYLHRHQRKKQKEKDAIAKNDDETSSYEDPFKRGINARNSAIINRFADKNGEHNDGYMNENSVSDLIPTNQLKNVIIADNIQKKQQTHGHGHSHMPLPLPHGEEEDFLVSSMRGLLIVLALSIHELFEGLAVGLEKSSGSVYYMFGAVAAHKFVIAFCVGVELMIQKTRVWLAFCYIVVYSIVSAIGIGVGILLGLGDNADSMQVPSVVLQGLATGTLLYVVFFEVLSKDRSGLIPYCAVLFGFLLMFGLQFIGK
ncbi:unnamed protein product [Diamesa serratosioi]